MTITAEIKLLDNFLVYFLKLSYRFTEKDWDAIGHYTNKSHCESVINEVDKIWVSFKTNQSDEFVSEH